MVAGCCCCHAEAMSRAEHLKAEEDLLARGIEWFRAMRPNTDVSWSVVDVALKKGQRATADFIRLFEVQVAQELPELVGYLHDDYHQLPPVAAEGALDLGDDPGASRRRRRAVGRQAHSAVGEGADAAARFVGGAAAAAGGAISAGANSRGLVRGMRDAHVVAVSAVAGAENALR